MSMSDLIWARCDREELPVIGETRKSRVAN